MQAEARGRSTRGVLVLDGGAYGPVEHVFEVVLRESRTLHVALSSDPACHLCGPAGVHWLGAPLVQANEDVRVVAKV